MPNATAACWQAAVFKASGTWPARHGIGAQSGPCGIEQDAPTSGRRVDLPELTERCEVMEAFPVAIEPVELDMQLVNQAP